MIGKTYTIEELKEKNLIIFECIMGSHAYGTSLPTSDTDIRGVFMQPLDDILKYGYEEQVSDETNDITYYELRRYLHLAAGNNPNVIELLFSPEDCVLKETDEWKLIKQQSSKFLTKRCRWTFAGYADEQIKKARGYNKKMNWEESEMTRKTVLDFCYVLKDGRSVPFKNWINFDPLKNTSIPLHIRKQANQKNFGLVAIDHAHNLYAMYYQTSPEWGLVSDEEKANDVQLTSIEKGLYPISYVSFNKDAYSTHCKKYKEYQTWLNERNEDRFKMNKQHGKNYDSKNLSHCIRLLDMVIEILDSGKLIVRRPEDHIKLLMKIRKGEMEYDEIITMAQEKIKYISETVNKSFLPDNVDYEFVVNLLINIRKKRYSLQ